MKLIFGRDMVGGEHEVAFVLAVFLVDEDDHAAGAQVGDESGMGERLMARPWKGNAHFTLGCNWPIWRQGRGRFALGKPRAAAAVDPSQSVCPPSSVVSNVQRWHDSPVPAGCRAHAGRGRAECSSSISPVEISYAQCIRSRPDRRRLGRRHDSSSESRSQANVTVKAVQPGLLEATGPRVHEAVNAGIQKIAAHRERQILRFSRRGATSSSPGPRT